jgi:hypothetical protein
MDPERASSDSQFTLQTVFWVTIAVALLLVYAKSLGQEAILQSLVYSGTAMSIGVLFGGITRRWKECFFWVCLMTLLAYLGVAGGRLPTIAIVYGWGFIGATTGGLAAIDFPRKVWQGALFSGAFAIGIMIVALKVYGVPIRDLVLFDVFCAGAIGAAVRPAVHWLKMYESQSKQSRLLIATWLTISVLIGNFLVPAFGGSR